MYVLNTSIDRLLHRRKGKVHASLVPETEYNYVSQQSEILSMCKSTV